MKIAHFSLAIFQLEQHLHTRTSSVSYMKKRNVQFTVIFRTCSPDHNGNASVVDKMPPLPPWLSRTAPQSEDASDKALSQGEASPSPRPRHMSDGSNGKTRFQFSQLQILGAAGPTISWINPIF